MIVTGVLLLLSSTTVTATAAECTTLIESLDRIEKLDANGNSTFFLFENRSLKRHWNPNKLFQMYVGKYTFVFDLGEEQVLLPDGSFHIERHNRLVLQDKSNAVEKHYDGFFDSGSYLYRATSTMYLGGGFHLFKGGSYLHPLGSYYGNVYIFNENNGNFARLKMDNLPKGDPRSFSYRIEKTPTGPKLIQCDNFSRLVSIEPVETSFAHEVSTQRDQYTQLLEKIDIILKNRGYDPEQFVSDVRNKVVVAPSMENDIEMVCQVPGDNPIQKTCDPDFYVTAE